MNDILINKDVDEANKYNRVDLLVIDDIYKTNMIDGIKTIIKNRYDDMLATVCIFDEVVNELIDIYSKYKDYRVIKL